MGTPNQNSTVVSGFDVNPGTGALSRITDVGFGGAPNQLPMGSLSTPDGNVLFLFGSAVGGSTATYVVQPFTIDHGTGKLSQFQNGKVTTGTQFRALVHPSSSFLYLDYQNYNSPSIGAYVINEKEGTLMPVSGQPFAVKTTGQLVADPSGNFLYIVGDHTIDAVHVDQQTGALSPVAGFPITVRPQAPPSPGRLIITLTGVMDPLGDFLFVLDTANGGAIWTYRTAKTTGALVLMPNSPFATAPVVGPTFVGQVDPTGHFLYLVDWYFDTIGGFSIDRTTGALTPVPGSPVQPPTWTPSGPTGGVLAVDTSGKFLYFMDGVIQNSSAQLIGYGIDQKTGSLNALASSPTATDFPGDLVITH